MSLTLKELELLDTASAYNGAQHNAICGKAALELIEYKKIEEDLGIDLALRHEVETSEELYYKDDQGNLIEVKYRCSWGRKGVVLSLPPYYSVSPRWYSVTCPWKDYGKTWALTKEELE